jgi:hypothetical protein
MPDLYDREIPWGLPPAPGPTLQAPSAPSTPDLLGWLYGDLVEVEAHLASVEADRDTYRMLAVEALERVAVLTKLVDRQQTRLRELLEVR